jgi:hypothetical protein
MFRINGRRHRMASAVLKGVAGRSGVLLLLLVAAAVWSPTHLIHSMAEKAAATVTTSKKLGVAEADDAVGRVTVGCLRQH